VKLPRIARTEQRFLTAVEVERVADAIGEHFGPLVYSGAYLGSRWGELAGLRGERLNLLKRQEQIVGTLEEVRDRLRYVDETKTSASRRLITIPPFLAEILEAHIKRNPGEFVFTSSTGQLLRRSNFRRHAFKPALERAGVDPDIRFHDLRHTCAALMIEQGLTRKRSSPVSATVRSGQRSRPTGT